MKSPLIAQVMTDYWEPYEHFVPPEYHIQSKAETFTVEGYNSVFRYFLARFRGNTKCYSKSERRLRYSVLLLMAKWNGELEYLLHYQYPKRYMGSLNTKPWDWLESKGFVMGWRLPKSLLTIGC